MSPSTPFLNVPRAISRIRWSARALESMSTPASLYVSPFRAAGEAAGFIAPFEERVAVEADGLAVAVPPEGAAARPALETRSRSRPPRFGLSVIDATPRPAQSPLVPAFLGRGLYPGPARLCQPRGNGTLRARPGEAACAVSR